MRTENLLNDLTNFPKTPSEPIVFPPPVPKRQEPSASEQVWTEVKDTFSYTFSFWKNLGAERGVQLFNENIDEYLAGVRQKNPTDLGTEAYATLIEAGTALGGGIAQAYVGMVEGFVSFGGQILETGKLAYNLDPKAGQAAYELGKGMVLGPVLFVGAIAKDVFGIAEGAAKSYWYLGKAAVSDNYLTQLDQAKKEMRGSLNKTGNTLGVASQVVLGARMPKLGGAKTTRPRPRLDFSEGSTIHRMPTAPAPIRTAAEVGQKTKAGYVEMESRAQSRQAAAKALDGEITQKIPQKDIPTQKIRIKERDTLVDYPRPVDPSIAKADFTPAVEAAVRKKLQHDRAKFLEGKSLLNLDSEAPTQRIQLDRRPAVRETPKLAR